MLQNFCELIFYYTFRTVLTKKIKTLWQKNPLRKQLKKLRRLLRRRSNQVQLDTLAKRSDPRSLLFFLFSFLYPFITCITFYSLMMLIKTCLVIKNNNCHTFKNPNRFIKTILYKILWGNGGANLNATH